MFGEIFSPNLTGLLLDFPQKLCYNNIVDEENMRGWRNGRRSGLKIRLPCGSEGSSPFPRTICRCTPIGRGDGLKIRKVWVRLPPSAPCPLNSVG